MNNIHNNIHLKRLQVNTTSLLMSPPEDSSEKTSVELELLENVGRRLKQDDVNIIENYNGDILNQYLHLVDQFSLNVNEQEIFEIAEDLKSIVLLEKTKHARNRPIVVAEKQGFELKETVQSEFNGSYPSGHSTESMFFSLYFADQFPLYKEVFMEMANKIANSRLLSSNNYPTDNLAGQTLAHVLFGNFKESKE